MTSPRHIIRRIPYLGLSSAQRGGGVPPSKVRRCHDCMSLTQHVYLDITGRLKNALLEEEAAAPCR